MAKSKPTRAYRSYLVGAEALSLFLLFVSANTTSAAPVSSPSQTHVSGIGILDTPTNTPIVTPSFTGTPLATPTCLPQLIQVDGSKQKPGLPASTVGENTESADGKYGFAAVALRNDPGKAEY